MSSSSEANGSSSNYPTSFGRGWIPVDRDIGLPDNEAAFLRHASQALPLKIDEATKASNHNTWTPARKAAFLHHLAETGNVRASAARVGLSHQSGYLVRRRDRVFRAGWDAALVLAREVAAQALATRALDGTPEAVWFRGQQVGTKVRYDGRLLLAHLARLDKAAAETEAGELAERFDELVARVAGEAPVAEMADLGAWDQPEALLPTAREVWADRAGQRLAEEAREQWQADVKARRATKADEPSDLHTPWFEAALAEWDAWHARACAAVDAAVEEVSLPVPKMTFPRVEIDMAAFNAPDDETDEELEERRTLYETAYSQDDIIMEYKSLELGLCGGNEGRDGGTSYRAPSLSLIPDKLGSACHVDTGNCGNLAQPAPSLRASRHPSALARLVAGQRPGRAGERPQRRSSPLKARASASAKLHAERQVIESETDGSGPLRTKWGAITGT